MSYNGYQSKEMPQPQGQAALTSQGNSNPGPGNKSEQQPPHPHPGAEACRGIQQKGLCVPPHLPHPATDQPRMGAQASPKPGLPLALRTPFSSSHSSPGFPKATTRLWPPGPVHIRYPHGVFQLPSASAMETNIQREAQAQSTAWILGCAPLIRSVPIFANSPPCALGLHCLQTTAKESSWCRKSLRSAPTSQKCPSPNIWASEL